MATRNLVVEVSGSPVSMPPSAMEHTYANKLHLPPPHLAGRDSGFLISNLQGPTLRLDSPQDFVDTILTWTPTVIEREDLYEQTISSLPRLPVLSSEAEYRAAYKPAILAETHLGLLSALTHPSKQARSTSSIEIVSAKRFRDTFEVALVLPAGHDIRHLDFVYLSTSTIPYQERHRFCCAGFIRRIIYHDEGSDTDATAYCEIGPSVMASVMNLVDEGKKKEGKKEGKKSLYLTVVGSTASSFRVFEGLCLGRMSKNLLRTILDPERVPEGAMPFDQAEGMHTRLIETLDSGTPLNYFQKKAILASLYPLGNPCSVPVLITGPPGTGKTHTITSMLMVIMKGYPNQLVQVCTPSNAAVRELALRTMRRTTDIGSASLAGLVLVGSEDAVDVTEGIDRIFLPMRVKRLLELAGKILVVQQELGALARVASGNQTTRSGMKVPRDEAIAIWKPRKESVQSAIDIFRTIIEDFPSNNNHSLDTMRAIRGTQALRLWCEDNEGYRLDLVIVRADLLKEARELLESLKVPPWTRERWQLFAMENASLVFSTVNATGKAMMRRLAERKPLMIVDEATQATEAEINLLNVDGARGLVMVGDVAQLPATVLSRTLVRRGFQVSMFERLREAGIAEHILQEQYRMHPQISAWPSAAFYAGTLRDGNNVTNVDRIPRWQGTDPSILKSYIFIDVPGQEEADHADNHRNVMEADVVVDIIKQLVDLVDKSPPSSGCVTIGIVNGYRAQIDLLRLKLQSLKNSKAKETASRVIRFCVTVSPDVRLDIDLASVDGFQGQERDVVIFCTTRANTRGNIGFLVDPRRLNVAITRARHSLIILGHADTLNHGEAWHSLIQDAKARRLFATAGKDVLAKTVTPAMAMVAELQRPTGVNTGGARVNKTATVVVPVQANLDDLQPVAGFLDNVRPGIWQIMFTKLCRRQLQDMTTPLAVRVVGIIKDVFDLGYRNVHKRIGSSINGVATYLRFVNVGKEEPLSLLWSVRLAPITASDPGKTGYQQVIWLWAIVAKNERDSLIRSIQRSCATLTPEYMELCDATSTSDNHYIPKSFEFAEPIQERVTTVPHEVVEGTDDFNQMDLVKAYAFDSAAEQALIKGVLESIEMPFVLSPEEWALVHSGTSRFVLGRSGTGKTTAMVLWVFAKHQANRGRTTPRQVILTANRALAKAIETHYGKLLSSQDKLLPADPKEILSLATTSWYLEDEDDDAVVPFQELQEDQFPLIWNVRRFLRSMNATVGGDSFHGFVKRHNGRLPTEIDFDVFRWAYYPRLPESTQKLFGNGASLFHEIQGVIKGTQEVLELGRPLTLQEYLQRETRRSDEMDPCHREIAYDAFLKYQKMKGERHGEWDLCDLVIDLYRRCQVDLGASRSFGVQSFAIDEIQDLPECCLILFKYIMHGPNACNSVFLAGDTAQTISSGVDFRFSDLKRLFGTEWLPQLAKSDAGLADRLFKDTRSGHYGHLVPSLTHLFVNYRSGEGVVALGSQLVRLLDSLFPDSIDKLEQEVSLVVGPRPVFLESTSEQDFLKRIFHGQAADAHKIEFGADQVVLVRNEAAKARIRASVPSAPCHTIGEVKGLEFEDVIIFDFVSDSAYKRWHLLEALEAGEVAIELQLDLGLRMELKLLYVASTRARSNLWFFDRSEEGTHLRQFLAKKQLVNVLGALEANEAMAAISPLLRASSENEWLKSAEQFMQRGLYADAIVRFEKAGASGRVPAKEAQCLLHIQEAKRALAKNRPAESSKKYKEAADLLSALGHDHRAARCYSEAASLSPSRDQKERHSTFAGDHYRKCPERPDSAENMINAYLDAGSCGVMELLDALSAAPWPPRNDLYYEAATTLAYRLDSNAFKKKQLLRAVSLFETTDQKVEFLEAQNHTADAEAILIADGKFMELALIYEARGDLRSAEKYWKSAKHEINSTLARAALTRTDQWLKKRSEAGKPPKITGDPLGDIQKARGRPGTRPSLELLEQEKKVDAIVRTFIEKYSKTRKEAGPRISSKVIAGLGNGLVNSGRHIRNHSERLLQVLRTGGDWEREAISHLGIFKCTERRDIFLVDTLQYQSIRRTTNEAKRKPAAKSISTSNRMCMDRSDLRRLLEQLVLGSLRDGIETIMARTERLLEAFLPCSALRGNQPSTKCFVSETGKICPYLHAQDSVLELHGPALEFLAGVLDLLVHWARSYRPCLKLLLQLVKRLERCLWPIDPRLGKLVEAEVWMKDRKIRLLSSQLVECLPMTANVLPLEDICMMLNFGMRTDTIAKYDASNLYGERLHKSVVMSRMATRPQGFDMTPLAQAAGMLWHCYQDLAPIIPSSLVDITRKVELLERLATWLICLETRFSVTILPLRWIQKEIIGPAPASMGLLLGRGSLAEDMKLRVTNQEKRLTRSGLKRVFNHLMGILAWEPGLLEFIDDGKSREAYVYRSIYTQRMITMVTTIAVNFPPSWQYWQGICGVFGEGHRYEQLTDLPEALYTKFPRSRTDAFGRAIWIRNLNTAMGDVLYRISDCSKDQTYVDTAARRPFPISYIKHTGDSKMAWGLLPNAMAEFTIEQAANASSSVGTLNSQSTLAPTLPAAQPGQSDQQGAGDDVQEDKTLSAALPTDFALPNSVQDETAPEMALSLHHQDRLKWLLHRARAHLSGKRMGSSQLKRELEMRDHFRFSPISRDPAGKQMRSFYRTLCCPVLGRWDPVRSVTEHFVKAYAADDTRALIKNMVRSLGYDGNSNKSPERCANELKSALGKIMKLQQALELGEAMDNIKEVGELQGKVLVLDHSIMSFVRTFGVVLQAEHGRDGDEQGGRKSDTERSDPMKEQPVKASEFQAALEFWGKKAQSES